MLKQRIITAVILAPLAIAGFVFLEGGGFALFVGAIVLLGAWEWARLAGETSQKGRVVYALVVGLFMVGLYRDAWPAEYLLIPALVWWIVALVLISRYPKGRGLWAGSMISQLFGLLILLPAWYGLVWLRALDNGLWLILAVLILVWAADVGAYVAGKTWGRHKLLPRVSPGKTVEGLIGGLAFTQLLTLGALLFLGWNPVALLLGLATAALVVLFSIVGDLTESLFKREQGLKDSSSLLPGHGGVLDRIDSLTAAVPVFALCWIVIGERLA
jgi:phosphatidate cytidylyltransferase